MEEEKAAVVETNVVNFFSISPTRAFLFHDFPAYFVATGPSRMKGSIIWEEGKR